MEALQDEIVELDNSILYALEVQANLRVQIAALLEEDNMMDQIDHIEEGIVAAQLQLQGLQHEIEAMLQEFVD
jgi:regulator of replication initiation timing